MTPEIGCDTQSMTIRAVRYVNDKPAVSHIGFMTDIGMEIRCDSAECPIAYRLDYTPNETNLDVGKLRREATAKVNKSHPDHPDVIVLKG